MTPVLSRLSQSFDQRISLRTLAISVAKEYRVSASRAVSSVQSHTRDTVQGHAPALLHHHSMLPASITELCAALALTRAKTENGGLVCCLVRTFCSFGLVLLCWAFGGFCLFVVVFAFILRKAP